MVDTTTGRGPLLLASALVLLGPAAGHGGELELVLQDHINRDWRRELVSFPVEFAKGACHAQSVALRGPRGPLACQLSDITRWPGTKAVKTATLWFIADVPKLARNEYTLSYADEPSPTRRTTGDLKVERKQDQVELTTSHFGIRLLLGTRQPGQALASKDVPGPVLALRAADGMWFGGGSRLYGPTQLKGYAARVVAEGPVFAQWTVRYTYADKNALDLSVTLAAGDNAVFFEQSAAKDAVNIKPSGNPAQARVNGRRPEDNGLEIGLTQGLAPLVLRCQKEHYLRRPFFKKHKTTNGEWADIPMADYPAGLVTNLVAWRDWWSTYTQTEIRLKRTDRPTELRIVRWDARRWVDPKRPEGPRRNAAKAVPLLKRANGDIVMSVSTLAGVRKWSIGEAPIPTEDIYAQCGHHIGCARRLWQVGPNDPRVGRGLDVVTDWVLDWKDPPGTRHPRMFISWDELKQRQPRLRKDRERVKELIQLGTHRPRRPHTADSYALAAYLRTGDGKLGRELELVDRLRHHLDMLGEYDIRAGTLYMACLYDGLIDSELVTPTDRKLFRAQMAYLAYKSADPATWSAERGYASGNPNMTVVVDMTRGLIGCMLRHHPESAGWVHPAVASMKRFMARVGPKGEWMESFHYSHVSASTLVPFAVAARRAQVHDFFADGRLKRLMLYLAKMFSPPDVQRSHLSVGPPWGRSTAGKAYGHSGVMAFAEAKTDPAYAKQMQWTWKRTGYSLNINYFGQRFGGFEEVITDRDLPAETPAWTGELFPQVGVLMRHGLGTKHEHWLGILTEVDTLFVRTPEAGSIMKWFSRGVPIGGAFAGGYGHRHRLFMCRVQPARGRGPMKDLYKEAGYDAKTKVVAFAALGPADYLRFRSELVRADRRWKFAKPLTCPVPEWPPVARTGKVPLTWQRQALLVTDASPAKASYLVLRDTVTGREPTMWQFWTLSDKIGTPEQARSRKAFLADKPGNRVAPARELKGDRFTALGQFSMDLEYFIAAPKDTPRHTLRFGDKYSYPIPRFNEYQDLMHLQLDGDGHYFVVLFPRLRKERTPTFESLGQGTVIKLSGGFGTDYVFLSDQRTTAEADEAAFTGTAGVVQDRKTGLVLALAATGRIVYKQHGIGCAAPVALRVGTSDLTVHLPRDHQGSRVTIQAPGAWTLKDPAVGATMAESSGKRFRLTVPKGVWTLVLERR